MREEEEEEAAAGKNELYNRETSVLNTNDDPMRYKNGVCTLSVVFCCY